MPSDSAAERWPVAPAARDAAPDAGQPLAPAHARRRPLQAAGLWALMAASGFSALGCQMVWTQQAALWLGHEGGAVLGVVAAFFGGMAIGAGVLAAFAVRSRQPWRWYMAFELVTGLWVVVLAWAMSPAASALMALAGPQPPPAWQWVVSFGGTLLLLLPGAAAMGAALPALDAVWSARQAGPADGGPGQRLPGLYAANTLGGLAGVLAGAFWLLPAWGLLRTATVCGALNLACAAIAWWTLREPGEPASRPRAQAHPHSQPDGRWAVLPMLALTGWLGIGHEVLVVRAISQVAENTVYTFALLLAVYLGGTALGAAAYPAWARWRQAGTQATPGPGCTGVAWLLVAAALACAGSAIALRQASPLMGWLTQALGPGPVQALAAEAALGLLAFGLPAVAMGLLFCHLMASARWRGIGLGAALAANTLGAAVAPLAFGLWAVPALGPLPAMGWVVCAYLVLALISLALSQPRPVDRQGRRAGRPAAGMLAMAALATGVAVVAWLPGAPAPVPPGGRLISASDGVLGHVSVVADAQGVRRLHINQRAQEGSSATGWADGRQAWLPLLLHPQPRQALFLGLGTGATARAATLQPGLAVRVVELLPEVVDASRHFAPAGPAPAGWQVLAADARRHVRTDQRLHDVIVSDNFHPARSGAAALYTVEHFQAVRQRLAADGLFCQWLPLHQLDTDSLRSIVSSYLQVFPGATALLASHSLHTPVLGLLARADGQPPVSASVHQRLARLRQDTAGQADPAAQHGLGDEAAVLGSFVAGPAALRRLAAGAPPNTDDRPVVGYRAPWHTYAPEQAPADRLLGLLQALDLAPDELLQPAAAPVLGTDGLRAHWRARDQYLRVGRTVQPDADVRRMLQQVREPLLQVLHIRGDFQPAFVPLLAMARALADLDRPAARGLAGELLALQPGHPDVVELLNELGKP